jgi:WD40 repeat protein
LTAHTQKVTSLQWLGGASKNLLVSVSLDKSAVVWDAYRGTKLASHHLDSEINCSVLLSTLSHSSSTLLYVGCQNRNLYEVALFTNGIAEIGNKRQATMHYNVL